MSLRVKCGIKLFQIFKLLIKYKRQSWVIYWTRILGLKGTFFSPKISEWKSNGQKFPLRIF